MFGRKKDTFKMEIKVDPKKKKVTGATSETVYVEGGRVTIKTKRTMTFDEIEQRAQAELEARSLEAQQNRPALGNED